MSSAACHGIKQQKVSGRRDILRLQAGIPVKNGGKTRYNRLKRGEARK